MLELTYTAWDLNPFAENLGYDGPPFLYDPERRFWLRCELDALFFHLYLGSAEEREVQATPELKALFPTPPIRWATSSTTSPSSAATMRRGSASTAASG